MTAGTFSAFLYAFERRFLDIYLCRIRKKAIFVAEFVFFNKYYIKMKRKLLRLLPVAAVLLTASCTDDNYDLSEVDTTSQFMVKDLVVPLNMSPIKLDAIIAIDEDDDIKKDENGNYYFEKVGQKKLKEDGSGYEDYCFKSEDVKVEKIMIKKPTPITQDVIVDIKLSQEIQNEWGKDEYKKMTIKDIRDKGLMTTIGLTEDMEIFSVNVNEYKDFEMKAQNIDKKITTLNRLGVDPLDLNIKVKLDGLQAVVSSVSLKGLTMDLPSGMTVSEITDRENNKYNPKDGKLSYGDTEINGQKDIIVKVTGLDYNAMKGEGSTEELFNPDEHSFEYKKKCGVTGTATIKIANMKDEATYQDIENAAQAYYSCNVGFDKDIVVNTFSGGINYVFEDDINIDPVKITHDDLPELFINDQEGEEVNIILDNPQLYLDIKNPFCDKNNIKPVVKLSITGNDTYQHDINLNKEQNHIMLSRNNRTGLKYRSGYTWESFADLDKILSGKKIPEELKINVEKPVLNVDNVKDFELGKDHDGIEGNWTFYSLLALSTKSVIKYIKEWDDWQSDDLDGLTVTAATVSFNLTKDVALNAKEIVFTLKGKDGKTLTGSTAILADSKAEFKEIIMKGGPVSNITAGKLTVTFTGKDQSINKDQEIIVSNLRLKVDGYYDKEF